MKDTVLAVVEKPVIGMMGSFGGAMINYLEMLSPYLNIASVCVGLLVGLMTLKKINKKINIPLISEAKEEDIINSLFDGLMEILEGILAKKK